MKNEDEKLREAARMLSANCEGRRDGCKGCLFCRDNLSCKINGIPVSWDSDFGLDEHIVNANKKVSTPTDTPTETVAPTDAPTASKTRQERFLKMFPHTVKIIADDVDVIDLCPGRLGERRRCPTDYNCGKCKREFWFEKEDSHD